MIGDLIAYSLRNLWTRKLRTSLTLIGIIIGVMSIVALVGLGNGLRDAITGQFALAGPDILTVTAGGGVQGPPGQGAPNPLQKDYLNDIDRLSSVHSSFGVVIQSVVVEYNNEVNFRILQTIPSDPVRLREMISSMNLRMEEGRFLNPGERNRVVLGSNIASSSNAFGRVIRVGDSILINDEQFRVVGILERRGSFIVDGSIRIDEDQAREMFGNDDEYNLISVRARSLNDVQRARADIEDYLRRERSVDEGKEDFSVQTSESALENVNTILSGVQIFIIIIASISIIVGAIGIVNTMFTSVVERTREIGIMKAIGATDETIFTLFFIESGIIGTIGGAIGALLGWLIAVLGTNALGMLLGTSANPDISFVLIASVLLGSFIIGSVSGIVPAVKASHLKPVDALRGA